MGRSVVICVACSTAGLRIDPARYSRGGEPYHISMALVALHDRILLPAAVGHRRPVRLPAGSRISSLTWAPVGTQVAFMVDGARAPCSPLDPEPCAFSCEILVKFCPYDLLRTHHSCNGAYTASPPMMPQVAPRLPSSCGHSTASLERRAACWVPHTD